MTRYCDICTEYTPEDGQLAIYKKKNYGHYQKIDRKKSSVLSYFIFEAPQHIIEATIG